jgi:cytoskeletal protein CcmA (bactofilin family)
MFKGKKKPKIDPNTTDTLIGEGTTFEGNIKSEASIRVEGNITGDIVCKGDVTIGDNGDAKSSISARNVIIAGIVRGNVTTTEKLTITSTGKLHGNTSSKTLIIDDGGVFLGNSKMGTSSTSGEEPTKEANPQSFNRNYNDSAANL